MIIVNDDLLYDWLKHKLHIIQNMKRGTTKDGAVDRVVSPYLSLSTQRYNGGKGQYR